MRDMRSSYCNMFGNTLLCCFTFLACSGLSEKGTYQTCGRSKRQEKGTVTRKEIIESGKKKEEGAWEGE